MRYEYSLVNATSSYGLGSGGIVQPQSALPVALENAGAKLALPFVAQERQLRHLEGLNDPGGIYS